MTYEWDEEIPQPKPPARHVGLVIKWYEDDGPQIRDATQSDIAKALGVTEAQLAAFLKNPTMACSMMHLHSNNWQQQLTGQLGVAGQQLSPLQQQEWGKKDGSGT